MSKCKQCGDCCRTQGSPPCIPEDIDRMPKEIAAIVKWFSAADPYRYDYSKECYFLSTSNVCLIYPYRPQACREFEPGKDCPQTVKGTEMFTQKELQDIEGKALECKSKVTHPHWERAYDRLAEAAFNLDRMKEASKAQTG